MAKSRHEDAYLRKLRRASRKKFKEWLEMRKEMAPHVPVGVAGDSSRDPIFNFFGIGMDQVNYDIPQWMDHFTWNIDLVASFGPREVFPDVALECLQKKIELEEQETLAHV